METLETIGIGILMLFAFCVSAGAQESVEKATFAGGCFWCMESPFEKLKGVKAVYAGYTGGTTEDPRYEDVSSGATGHMEAVQIIFDPANIAYEELLNVFWRQIDPTDVGGQFADRGSQYRTAIFYHSESQKNKAEQSKKALMKSGVFQKPVVTPIIPFTSFYKAEEYHQQYYQKCPLEYQSYRSGSGREAFLKQTWSKENDTKFSRSVAASSCPVSFKMPSEKELKKMLTPLQYTVTQQSGTEPAFNNTYWDNKKEGIYVDVVSGEPLFCSLDKFESGTGWPSFTKSLEPDNVIEKKDETLGVSRTEVCSASAHSHLGHVFDDGPEPIGQRYCINSAAVRFIPKEDLQKEGYGEYLSLFEEKRD